MSFARRLATPSRRRISTKCWKKSSAAILPIGHVDLHRLEHCDVSCGGGSPNKADAKRLREAAITASERLVIRAEVVQEMLHQYAAIDRRDDIQPAFDRIPGVSRYRG